MDEDESGARQTDWEVSERCNYSSQQGEGEITTHSVLHTTLPASVRACVCMYIQYVLGLHVTCVCRRVSLSCDGDE